MANGFVFAFVFLIYLNTNLCSDLSHKGSLLPGRVLLFGKSSLFKILLFLAHTFLPGFLFVVVVQKQQSIGQDREDLNLKSIWVEKLDLSATLTSFVE